MGRDSPCTLQHTDARHAGPQTILSQYRRLPGFHSEFVGLEIMNESMTQIGVEDFLNGDCHTASSPPSLQIPCMSLARRRLQAAGNACCSAALGKADVHVLVRCLCRSAREHAGADCDARGDGAAAGSCASRAFPSQDQQPYARHALLVSVMVPDGKGAQSTDRANGFSPGNVFALVCI